MDEIEQRFLAAIAANPEDPEPRSVYADWLDERGDPRGEYLRLEAQLHSIPPRLEQLEPAIAPAWLAAIARVVDVFLVESGPQKIACIKEIRQITGLGLKEAKDLCEAASPRTPQLLRERLPLLEAKTVARHFTDIGARVQWRGPTWDPETARAAPATATYQVVLTRTTRDRMIQTIAAIREITNLGLADAKDLVDAVLAGERTVIAAGLDATRADAIVARFAGVASAERVPG